MMSNLAKKRESKWSKEEGELVLILTNGGIFREDRSPECIIVELRFVQKHLTAQHLKTIRRILPSIVNRSVIPEKVRELSYGQFMAWIDEVLKERIDAYLKASVWYRLYAHDTE
jgi:hypothetical protein